MAKPLVVYFQTVPFFQHSRRVYIAARSKASGHRLSGFSAETLGYGQSQVAAGTEKGKDFWTPTFISQDSEEGVWMEIRDHDTEAHIYADHTMAYGVTRGYENKKVRRPSNEAAFIRCATLEACKEAFTLNLDRALAAAGVPREEL